MFVVTGGAGFIGSNLVKLLNEKGHSDVVVVDDLKDGHKFINIADLEIYDYMDRNDFMARILAGDDFSSWGKIDCIFHEGACSDTTEWDGCYIMKNNYEYTKNLMDFAVRDSVPLIYASSAATYGGRDRDFIEERQYEGPLNIYGYTKFMQDQYLRRLLPTLKSQIVALRYFNVYGPREQHKGRMASVAFHLNGEMLRGENPRLFKGCMGYGDGMQMRDFVYVRDVCAVNYWFYEHRGASGIYNCGTGRAEPFLNIAKAVIAYHGHGEVEFIPFPDDLVGKYQAFTQADLTKLRAAGCDVRFHTVAEGVGEYMEWLNGKKK